MLKHRIEQLTNRAGKDVDMPDGCMVVEVPKLDKKTLHAIPDYLYESIESRFETDSIYPAMPLVIEIGGQLRISERAIWNVLVECDSAHDWVSYYVAAAIEASEEELAHCTRVDVLGQEPLYAYIDRWFRRLAGHVSTVPAEQHTAINAFEAFIESCDMMHEVHQDDYIHVVITYLWSEPLRAADFIVQRWTQGQNVDFKGQLKEQVLRQGYFKNIVNQFIPYAEEYEEDTIYHLVCWCAHVYGGSQAGGI